MNQKTFKTVVPDIKKYVLKYAKRNGWLWFYNMHQKEVLDCAKKLLKVYKADKKIVIIACWLHDITKYQAKNNQKSFDRFHKSHHLDGYKFAKKFLAKYEIRPEEIESIAQCVLRHRNSPPHKAKKMEEKIVTTADAMSHFSSIFYLTYFKFFPDDTIEEMVRNQTQKLKRERRDLQLLPKSFKLVEKEYKTIKKLISNYTK